MPWELAALAVILAAAWLWRDSLRAREHAVAAGRAACARYGVQLLDETVAFARLRLARDDAGRLRLRRTYVFEFSETGDNRRHGAIVMLGARRDNPRRRPVAQPRGAAGGRAPGAVSDAVMPRPYSLLIRHGTVIDGTRAP